MAESDVAESGNVNGVLVRKDPRLVAVCHVGTTLVTTNVNEGESANWPCASVARTWMAFVCDVVVVSPIAFHDAVPVRSPVDETVSQLGFVSAVYTRAISEVAVNWTLMAVDMANVPS